MNIDKFIPLLEKYIETADIRHSKNILNPFRRDWAIVTFSAGETKFRVKANIAYSTLYSIDIEVNDKLARRLRWEGTLSILGGTPNGYDKIKNIIKNEINRRGDEKASKTLMPDEFTITFKDGDSTTIDYDSLMKWFEYYKFKPEECKSREDFEDKLMVAKI